MMVRWKSSNVFLMKVSEVEKMGNCTNTVKEIMGENFQNWKKKP